VIEINLQVFRWQLNIARVLKSTKRGFIIGVAVGVITFGPVEEVAIYKVETEQNTIALLDYVGGWGE
jgi:hypothetical protein